MNVQMHFENAVKQSRHSFKSISSSIDDDNATQGNKTLIKLIANSTLLANEIEIVSNNEKPDSRFYNVFPGEHYRIIAALLLTLEPKVAIDIGTSTGMSARIMLDFTSKDTVVHTFDLIGYEEFNTHLNSSDFASGRIVQHAGSDLSDSEIFGSYLGIIEEANFVMCDAPKDGNFEYVFLGLLSKARLEHKPRLLILDDIRFENMWRLWRMIDSPKVDITSVGHWSGTGIVDISRGLKFKEGMLSPSAEDITVFQ